MAGEQLDATFAALSDPTRRAILTRLAGGESSVKDLARVVGEVKPRFPEQFIIGKIEELSQKHLLLALSPTEQTQ